MKMPEKHDLLAAILAAKEQGIGAILAFAMAHFRGRYNGGAFTKNSNLRNDVRHYRLKFIRDLLDFAGLSSNLAYKTSGVYRLASVPTGIGSLIKTLRRQKSRSRRW